MGNYESSRNTKRINEETYLGVFIVSAMLATVTGAIAAVLKIPISLLEVAAVFTSYWATLLCNIQSRYNYPIGAVSTILYSILFWQQGLYASMLINIYLPIALIYGWFRWGSDTETRPVTLVKPIHWLSIYLPLTLAGGALVGLALVLFGATLPYMDGGILVLTILAQWLLDNKKLETWFVWMVINVLAICTYGYAGLYLVAMQYVFFFGNAIAAFLMWNATRKK